MPCRAGLLRAVSVAGMLLLLSCSAPLQSVSLPAAGLQLQLPASWQLQRAERETLLFARPSQDNAPIPGAYLMLVRHPQRTGGAEPTLGSYIEFVEQQARYFTEDYELLRDDSVRIAGQPARRHLRDARSRTRQKRELALIWVQDGYGYQLTAAATPDQFGRLRADFERAAASLRRVGG